jgi:23S rRNA (cytosine1962-C5)-methyltransferase
MTTLEFRLKPGKESRLARGCAWAFRNEIDFQEKDPGNGHLVRLLTSKGRPLGVGFMNTAANLSFRLLARHGEFPLDADAWTIVEARLKQALEVRGPRQPLNGARRLVFGEGDWLSGLIVDDYAGHLAVQFHSWGLERLKPRILEALKALSGCQAIVDRSDNSFRTKEGLAPSKGVLWAAPGFDEAGLAQVAFEEDGLRFKADLIEGHKTGFFLDQRPSRALARSLASGRRCLDVFCFSGGFAVSMAKGGAASVQGLDQSAEAIALAAEHAGLNGVGPLCRFEEGDAFVRLREMEKAGERFGLIVLDPPAMAKDGEAVGGALRGYKELNLRALRLLEPGGLLLTCSCTQAVSEEQFCQEIQSAAQDAPATLRELQRLGAGSDHPRLLGMDETRYLKCLLLRKD